MKVMPTMSITLLKNKDGKIDWNYIPSGITDNEFKYQPSSSSMDGPPSQNLSGHSK